MVHILNKNEFAVKTKLNKINEKCVFNCFCLEWKRNCADWYLWNALKCEQEAFRLSNNWLFKSFREIRVTQTHLPSMPLIDFYSTLTLPQNFLSSSFSALFSSSWNRSAKKKISFPFIIFIVEQIWYCCWLFTTWHGKFDVSGHTKQQ